MADETAPKKTMKQKAAHEGKELLILTAYLGFFFCALTTYKTLLLKGYESTSLDYGFALLNALIIAKVILIGDFVKVVHKYEAKALVWSIFYKAFVYGIFVFIFHLIEEAIKNLIHHGDIGKAFHDVKLDQTAIRCLIIFGTFLPLFAFRELRRVIGEEEFHHMVLHAGGTAKAAKS
jgi:protein-S-isoprenylcysteine O-methyltransferase Ste14